MSQQASSQQGPNPIDRTLAVFSALNPLLLLVVGYILNTGIDQNKAEIEKAKISIEETSRQLANLKTIAETTTIELQQRINKVKVINDFLAELSGPDERKRSLAIEAILIALPDEAQRLVRVIEKFSQAGDPGKSKDVATAQDALAGVRARLVSDMFATERNTRVETLTTLERGWTDDTAVVDLLIARASQDIKARPTDAAARQQLIASVFNTVKFLSSVRVPADAALRVKIQAFLIDAAPVSADTKELAARIKVRFD